MKALRVNEIHEAIRTSNWNHCPGSLNPADIPSRGLPTEELYGSKFWRYGPDLSQIPEGIPSKDEMPEPCVAEMKAHSLMVPVQEGTVSRILAIERFGGTVHKLFRVTAYVLKFIKLLQGKSNSSELTTQDLEDAEQLWIKDCQKDFPRWKLQFGLFLDENGVWRCGGRLQNAKLPFSTMHPILLDRFHQLTRLIVRSVHATVVSNRHSLKLEVSFGS